MKTGKRDKGKGKQAKQRAALGGETVEPRVLLSATWLDLSGDERGEVAGGEAIGSDSIGGDAIDPWQDVASNQLAHLLGSDPPSGRDDGQGLQAKAGAQPPSAADGAFDVARTARTQHLAAEPQQHVPEPHPEPIGTALPGTLETLPNNSGGAPLNFPRGDESGSSPREATFTMSTPRRDGGAPDTRLPFGLLPDDLLDDGTSSSDRRVALPDLLLAQAGETVTLRPPFEVAGEHGDSSADVHWTQLSGTPVALEAADDNGTNVRLPQVFVEEELVFRVEMHRDGERIVQEITVHVQPVDMTNLPLSIDRTGPRTELPTVGDSDDVRDGQSRGIGKIWGAMMAFVHARNRGRSAAGRQDPGMPMADHDGPLEPLPSQPPARRPFRSQRL